MNSGTRRRDKFQYPLLPLRILMRTSDFFFINIARMRTRNEILLIDSVIRMNASGSHPEELRSARFLELAMGERRDWCVLRGNSPGRFAIRSRDLMWKEAGIVVLLAVIHRRTSGVASLDRIIHGTRTRNPLVHVELSGSNGGVRVRVCSGLCSPAPAVSADLLCV